LGVIGIAMVRETMCLYDGSQWCGVNGEEVWTKHWTLGNSCGQLMCLEQMGWDGIKRAGGRMTGEEELRFLFLG